jgi:N-acetylglutamate synthase-like GNAT family acetyltransferase
MRIRAARPDEAAALSDLCMRSKAAWGYDASFLEASRTSLTLTADRIGRGGCWVAEGDDGDLLGVAAIVPDGTGKELDLLFVEPGLMHSGVGCMLLARVADAARTAGAFRLTILADPHATAFYQRCGAVQIGEAPSDAITGRSLPLLEIRL